MQSGWAHVRGKHRDVRPRSAVAAHDPVEVVPDPLIVNRDDIVQRTQCTRSWRLLLLLAWLRLATSSSARFGGRRQPYLIVRKILYVIAADAGSSGRHANKILLFGPKKAAMGVFECSNGCEFESSG